MKNRFLSIVLTLLAASVLASPPERYIEASRPIEGEYIVVLDPMVPDEMVAGLAAGLSHEYNGELHSVITSAANAFFVTMNEAKARALSRNPKVLVVEENGRFEPSSTIEPTNEWHLDRIDHDGLNGYYTSCETGQGVFVYVVDTGVAKDHSEFQTASGSKVLNGVAFSNDYRPHPDDPVGTGDVGTNPCGGWTHAEGTTNEVIRTYNGGHGTSVASLIAGNTLGVAPGANIVPVKIGSCPDPGAPASENIEITTQHVCWGLDWIVGPTNPYRNLGEAVVNMSIFIPVSDSLISSFEHVVQGVIQEGITVVTSANNKDDKHPDCSGRPTCLPDEKPSACQLSPSRMAWSNSTYSSHVITVGGTRASDIRWCCAHTPGDTCSSNDPGSNYDGCVDIYAPAHDLNSASLLNENGIRTIYETRSGTSFSSAIVSGIVAQMLEWDPTLEPADVWTTLQAWSQTLANTNDPHNIDGDSSTPAAGSLLFARTRDCN